MRDAARQNLHSGKCRKQIKFKTENQLQFTSIRKPRCNKIMMVSRGPGYKYYWFY
jgi:hypothetical protein